MIEAQKKDAEIAALMVQIDAARAPIIAHCAAADEMGITIPMSVIASESPDAAQHWWEFQRERLLARWKKKEHRQKAIAKLTEEERKALGL
jgi:hypothetical protein